MLGTTADFIIIDDIEPEKPTFKLSEGFKLQLVEAGAKPTETPKEAVERIRKTAGVCPKNPTTHRHLPTNLVTDTISGCRFCGEQIERAHVKSTRWSLRIVDPSKKPSKALLRAKKKVLRKAFARKDTVGSTRADSKRQAHAYVEKRLGRKVTWKYARKVLAKMARAERGVANG